MVRQKPRKLDDPGPSKTPAQPRKTERRERRSPISILVQVCGFDSKGRIFSELSSTRNISRSGCCIHLQSEPLRDSALALQVVPRDSPVPPGGRQLLYQVAWLRPLDQGWEVGVFALSGADLLQVAFALFSP
jgi:hypothetical protein